jgi:hypothetical protein
MNSDFEMSIEDVQETLDAENKRERIEVPAGNYVCQIKEPLSDVRQDSKGHNKILMPIEISGNAELDGQWLFEAIYMNNQHDEGGKVKDGIGKRKVARYAHACGLKSLKNLNELEGKFVRVKYGPNKNGYKEVKDISPFAGSGDDGLSGTGVNTILPEEGANKVNAIAEQKDDLPF